MFVAKLIDKGLRDIGVSGEKKWAVVHESTGTVICLIESYFKNPEGIANGIVESLNGSIFRLDMEI